MRCHCLQLLFFSLLMPQATAPFSAKTVALTVAHCGDTRILLCSTDSAKVFRMTDKHHADARVESIRLRRMMGASLITDSFGESRWMGALENTRGLGDIQFKKFGVTPEPEIRTKLLEGNKWAYMVLVSDGVSSILSDDEVADLARGAPDPKVAAEQHFGICGRVRRRGQCYGTCGSSRRVGQGHWARQNQISSGLQEGAGHWKRTS
ncbi:phosphatase 2C-domain-containing protein [Armillaria borealis]|uniref:Phosphatase 2C-domain-containing protein n=1 Tax=Armillaria borealis TaxID=47425 RepID=A0AA39K8T4_9AGAR|nr:phosphatase 2C-domain-containing protein [Armillaria borealis]